MTGRYAVIWSVDAEADLARLWLEDADRNALAVAANELDRQLSHAPEQKGVHLAEGLRTIDQPPLRVIFELSHFDRVVRVVKVKHSSA